MPYKYNPFTSALDYYAPGVTNGLMVIDAGDMMPVTTNGATFGHREYTTNDVEKDYYAFDSGTKEYTQYSAVFPENWDRGTLKAKFIYSSDVGSSIDDVVVWGLSAMAVGNGDLIDVGFGAESTVSGILLADNGDQLQITDAIDVVTISGTISLNDSINLRFFRVPGGMTEDAWLFKVLIQYGIDDTISGG